jgi:two-component system, NtrC family, response regulator AtoC
VEALGGPVRDPRMPVALPVRYRAVSVNDLRHPSQKTTSRSSERWELTVFAGDAVVVHPLPASGAIAIGRAEGNDVRVDHTSVSRRHAVLHVGPPLRIEDLGGTNATSVRAARKLAETGKTESVRQISRQAVEIAPGDCITVGSAVLVVRRAQAAASAPSAAAHKPSAPAEAGGVVLQDEAMRALYEQAQKVARGTISILVLGETGTGKEVLAQAIHRGSSPRRARGPFVALNCAALTETLLEGELFGYVKGAFTGALKDTPGLFEAADGGTVFLDEVGEMPLSTQSKLLRVLEERQVVRVGDRIPRSIDVRFLSATNRDLEADVARGTFRADLYFRLNGVALTIPPLRDRVADIAPLARLFLERACKAFEREQIPAISGEALAALERHPWPGNLRELRNVIERAVAFCAGDTLLPEHLSLKTAAPAAPAAAKGPVEAQSAVEPSERQRIIEALEKCVGNQTYAAELLGMPRRTLVFKIKAYDIPRPRKPRQKS